MDTNTQAGGILVACPSRVRFQVRVAVSASDDLLRRQQNIKRGIRVERLTSRSLPMASKVAIIEAVACARCTQEGQWPGHLGFGGFVQSKMAIGYHSRDQRRGETRGSVHKGHGDFGASRMVPREAD